LYEKLGFVVVHERPCYYSESREDGLVMEYDFSKCRFTTLRLKK
jgi:hypothetical protein